MAIKLLFWPWWISENPYQKLLIEQLLPLGVEIVGDDLTRITSLITSQKPDILHLHWLDPYFVASNPLNSGIGVCKLIGKLAILRALGTKIVWTVHNLKNHEGQNSFLGWICSALVARMSHGIIAHSESAKHEIINTLHLKDDRKLFVIPHGNYIDFYENKIDQTAARKILEISDLSLVLLFLGWLRPYKGVLELIDSFKHLPQERIELLIAGKPKENEFVELIQQKIKGQENIKLIAGFVPEERLQVYMNACDVVVFPYREILTSGSVLLAMSFGRACIAPRKGCMSEVLDESGAFLYEPDAEEGLLKAMSRAIQTKAALINMGKYNRQLAEKYSWNGIAKMTLDVYQWCLRR